ncbi:MAG: HNH endonuclease [Planctomycetes bacterium]|nr:HNH endonuclease [Planctomycetota bacterium]
MSKKLLYIWLKTQGHCHFCGDPVIYEKRGWKKGNLQGAWEVDHVIQKDKGGKDSSDNYLPACTICNRYRWHRTGSEMREILLYGIIAREQVKRSTPLGKQLYEIKYKRIEINKKRRSGR